MLCIGVLTASERFRAPPRALAGALAGCSAAGDNPFTVFADPGKYEYYSCDQINAQRKNWSTREQELRELMNKAEQDTGGAIVNVLAYKADHVAASEELKVLEATARSKNCETPGELAQQQHHSLTRQARFATPA